MALGLEDCPDQVVTIITEHLTLRDICNLRLTSRSLNFKATQNSFRSALSSTSIYLTRDSLQKFVNAGQFGSHLRMLREVIVYGVVVNVGQFTEIARTKIYGENARKNAQQRLRSLLPRQAADEELRESKQDEDILSRTLRNLPTDNRAWKVSLRTVVDNGIGSERRLPPASTRKWRSTWQVTAETFATALSAIASSGMPIESFNVFAEDEQCSIACDKIAIAIPDGLSMPSVKSLALSFSDRDIPTVKSHDNMQAQADDETNFAGLVLLLQACPNLETLELHHYALSAPKGIRLGTDRYLQRISGAAVLSRLRNLTLRGFASNEEDMLSLLDHGNLKKLSLYRITLLKGSWRSIFDRCTDDESSMEELRFDHLSERGVVRFGDAHVGVAQRSYLPVNSTLDRAGKDVKTKIPYHIPPYIQPPGNPFTDAARQETRRMYGPPPY